VGACLFRCRLLAHSVIRGMSAIWSLLDQSGHCSALALNGSVVIDPKRTCHAAYMSRLLEELGIEVIF